jgi:uncharacterized membrane protein YgcG
MSILKPIVYAFKAVGFLFRLGLAIVLTVVGWSLVGELVASGELPRAPLGLAEMGFPETLLGLPTVYALGLVLFAGMVVFGDGGSSGAGGGGGFDGGGGDGGE